MTKSPELLSGRPARDSEAPPPLRWPARADSRAQGASGADFAFVVPSALMPRTPFRRQRDRLARSASGVGRGERRCHGTECRWRGDLPPRQPPRGHGPPSGNRRRRAPRVSILFGTEGDAQAQNLDQREARPAHRRAATIISTRPFGSPDKPRATKLAPAASAITTESKHGMLVPLGAIGLSQSGSVVGEGWPLGHAEDAVVHNDVGDVDVAPTGMQEMVAANGIAVAEAIWRVSSECRLTRFKSGVRNQLPTTLKCARLR